MSQHHPTPDGHSHPPHGPGPQDGPPAGYATPDASPQQNGTAQPGPYAQHDWAPQTGGWSEHAGWPQVSPTRPKGLSIAAIVLGLVGVLFVPVLFGGAGIVCAAIAKAKGHQLANVALGVSIGGTALGVVIGVVVGVTMMS